MPVSPSILLYALLISGWAILSSFQQSAPKVQHNIDSIERLVVHYRYNKPDSALFLAKKGLQLAKLTNDELGVARMLNQLGMIADNSGNSESSRQHYLGALEIYERLKNTKGISRENVRLGVVENRKGNSTRAISYFLHALRVSEKTRDSAGIMEAYITLGEVYANQRNYARAIHFYKRAENAGLNVPFSSLKLNICLNFGTAYRETGDYARAISYFEKGISQSNFPEMMGLNISLTNGLAQVYANAGARDKAIALQKAALEKSRKIRNAIREFQSLMALAESYQPFDYTVSHQYLEQALALAKENKTSKQIIQVLAKLADLEAARHSFKEAHLLRSQQYAIADSFYFKNMSLKLANLEAQYELEKSRDKVAYLNVLNSKQALDQIIMLWITLGSIAMLVILGVYYFKIRKLNLLLNETNTALSTSNNVKDKLFSVLAHDLRAPLASVLNLLGLINRGWVTEEERSVMITKLESQVNVSMETLNLLLQWGKMQLKGVVINQLNLDPQRFIDRNIALLQESAEQKSITISYETEPQITVFCDGDHLDFLIRNTLSNAIKFTAEGGHISIAVRRYQDEQVIFSIKDNGVGIESSRLETIFNVDNISTTGTNNEKGTSLGLVISKEFIIANQGRIWVESEIGKGSEFFFTLRAS